MKILVVDDEEDIVNLISGNLQREGYKVIPALTGEDALDIVRTKKPDLIVLDLMLPGIQGLEVCKTIRANPEHAAVPIIIVSAKANEVDRVLGLEMGADDYITKPFSVRELVSRVRAALRRVNGNSKKEAHARTYACRELFIDFDKHDVLLKGQRVDLSPTELKLLFFFARNPGKVYTRDQLLNHVWGEDVFVTARNVDVHISRLRRLIEENPQKPKYIVTVTSVGYKFDDSNG